MEQGRVLYSYYKNSPKQENTCVSAPRGRWSVEKNSKTVTGLIYTPEVRISILGRGYPEWGIFCFLLSLENVKNANEVGLSAVAYIFFIYLLTY